MTLRVLWANRFDQKLRGQSRDIEVAPTPDVDPRRALIMNSVSYAPWLADKLTAVDHTAVADLLFNCLYGSTVKL